MAKPTKTEFIVWGWHPITTKGFDAPVRVARYESQKQVQRIRDEGWLVGVYAAGDEPVALALQVKKEAIKRGMA